jgi:hypothetical protein
MLKNSWFFPIIQSVHLVGIAMMVGTIILTDLQILGLQRQTVSASWRRAGLAIMLITGPVLFISDIPRYMSNPAFLVKMVVLVLAFTVQRKQTKFAAVLSIILWSCVVLGGRAIADFDV